MYFRSVRVLLEKVLYQHVLEDVYSTGEYVQLLHNMCYCVCRTRVYTFYITVSYTCYQGTFPMKYYAYTT